MEVSAWHDGDSTFGIRVGKQNRDRYFKKSWTSIQVSMDGQIYSFALTNGFWHKCPEFRDKVIKKWLQQHYLIPWEKGHPPKMHLIPLSDNAIPLSDNAFRLEM
jgi:hypothetical protein